MIITNINHLAKILEIIRDSSQDNIVATSGGFDPLHVGHVRCIRESKLISSKSLLVVIVNGDNFLIRKKGKAFMPLHERMEIVDSMANVDFVVPWEDDSQTVVGALEILKPNFFTKGGDRTEESKIPEVDICKKIDCKIIYGIGGTEKIQSSSSLVKNYINE